MRWTLLCGVVVVAALVGSSASAGDGGSDRLRSPSRDVPAEWLTVAERSGFKRTPRYDETIAFGKRLAAASPWVRQTTFGRSPQGRDLALLIAARNGAFTPEAARASGNLVVLVQNCIHAGECAGKDASLMLLRDMVVTKTRAGLLDNITLLVIPIFNVDGHERFSAYSRSNQNGPEEMGWRVTSRNLNLNRDYIKADTEEMRAWLSLWNTWQPDFHFDNHTTDGGDWRYDVIFDADTHATASKSIARWLQETLFSHLFSALEGDGHVPARYFNLRDSRDPAKGIRTGGFTPRFATGYVALRNRPSVLVEMHALKPYRTRVIGNYNIMLHTLELLNRDADSLRQAIRSADAQTAEHTAGTELAVVVRTTDQSTPLTFRGYAYRQELSEISGAVRVLYDNTSPVDIETVRFAETEPKNSVTPPLAYVIPPQWSEAIELVTLHGLRAERLAESVDVEVESYRFADVSFASRSFEGRVAPRFEAELITESRTLIAGSVIVPLDQAGAKVAVHMFEPEAPDSLVRWGLFNAIFERKEYAEAYVLEKLARRMLEATPGLREEFEKKVKEDRTFASNARARLYFFYERSPYKDAALNLYPISRLIRPLAAKTIPLDGGGPN